MTTPFQTTKREEIKSEILTLLDVLYNKVDLERKFGGNLLRLSSTDMDHTQSEKDTPTGNLNKKVASDGDQAVKKIEHGKTGNIEALKVLEEEAKQCAKCSLCKSRTHVVFGTGSPHADLMFVGEAPGYYEDIKGEPFVGKAGQLLTKIIESIGLKRDVVYIANVLKCRPPENRNPSANEIISCKPFLFRQIDLINPKIICALGTFAAQALLDSKAGIGTLRGKMYEFRGTKLVVTYHPAYLLRNPAEKRKTWEDMKKIRDFLKSNNFTV